ncbi:MAG: DUF2237 family protein [Marinicella sp.]
MIQHESLNVYGEVLEPCGEDPVTGFFRDGCCNTADEDQGMHTVCVQLTAEFLNFSKQAGNDLSTPHPEFDFPGLVPGDRWCLCALRWLQAYEADAAPRVFVRSTHMRTLDVIELSLLRKFAVDLQ